MCLYETGELTTFMEIVLTCWPGPWAWVSGSGASCSRGELASETQEKVWGLCHRYRDGPVCSCASSWVWVSLFSPWENNIRRRGYKRSLKNAPVYLASFSTHLSVFTIIASKLASELFQTKVSIWRHVFLFP